MFVNETAIIYAHTRILMHFCGF